MLAVAAWVVAALLAAVLLPALVILATPLRLRLFLTTTPGFRMTVDVRLLGGLTPTIPIHDSRRSVPPKRQRRADSKAAGKPATGGRQRFRAAPRAIASTPRLLTDMLKPIHVERLAVDGVLGLDDPADTGQLFGVVTAARYALPARGPVSIALQPDFAGPSASGTIEACLRFIPIALVPPVTRFAWRVFGTRP